MHSGLRRERAERREPERGGRLHATLYHGVRYTVGQLYARLIITLSTVLQYTVHCYRTMAHRNGPYAHGAWSFAWSQVGGLHLVYSTVYSSVGMCAIGQLTQVPDMLIPNGTVTAPDR